MKPSSRKKIIWALSISLLGPLLISSLYFSGLFQRLELIAYDTMVRLMRAHKTGHPDVALIMIDEASLRAMDPLVGRWPWPRSVFADVLEFLYMGNPRAVALDILFTENEKDCLHESGSGGLGPSDRSLVASTAAGGTVYHAQQIFRDTEDEVNKALLGRDMPGDFRERFAIKGLMPSGNGPSNNFNIPFHELYRAAKGAAVVSFVPDEDGVFRRTRPLRQYKENCFPVMGIAPVIDMLNIESVTLEDRALVLDGLRIPLDGNGNYIINMYGKFNTYSISGILSSIQNIRRGDVEGMLIDPAEFEGKLVFIGASAVGVEDLKSTPISNRTPGVILHASLASNILLHDFLVPAGNRVTVLCIFLFFSIVSFSILLSQRLSVRLAMPLLCAAAYTAFVVTMFKNGTLYEVVPPAASLAFGFIASFVYLAFTEGKERRRVRKMLGQYVSPQVLSEIVDRHEEFLKAEVGSREYITVLFSDIRGFTAISESMPPDRIVNMLNNYFSVWTDVIFKYGGTVDKFVGDAVMAVWGAPLKTADHAEQAVRAACEMTRRLVALNMSLEDEGYPPIKIGIGINTGEAILGNIGSEKKLDYTVIGDTVNLASRIESLTKEYGCDILISESTHSHISGEAVCSFMDKVKVKGKAIPVNIYKVEGGGV